MSELENFLATVFDRADALLREGGVAAVESRFSLATNQRNGIVSYSDGVLRYSPTRTLPGTGIFVNVQLFEAGVENRDATLLYYFSDRRLDIDPPPSPGTFGNSLRQPFSANATDRIRLNVSRDLNAPLAEQLTVSISLATFGEALISFKPEVRAGVLVGVGGPIGPSVPDAAYLISLAEPTAVRPPR